MDDVERLARRVDELERRLGALERRAGAGALGEAATFGTEAVPAGGAGTAPAASSFTEALPLVGRTLVVFGGAFALRATTESGIVPQSVGAMLGIAYAVSWLVFADRAAARGRAASSGFHALAAAGIGYPLLVEATLRFRFLSPATAAAALVAITALALGIAARRNLRAVAWMFTLGATGTATVLGVASHMPILFGGVLLLLALATLVLSHFRGWYGPALVVALVADGLVLLLGIMVLVGDPARVGEVVDSSRLIALQLALVLLYLGTFYVRTLLAGKAIAWIEIAQGIAVLLVGLGGASAVTTATDVSHMPVGLVSLVLALGSYASSFTFIDRARERRVSFIFYSTIALVFTLAGIEVLFDGAGRAILLAVAALVASLLGSARGRATLSLHGSVYLVAAAAGSALPAALVACLRDPSGGAEAWATAPVILVLAVAAVCSWLTVATHGATWGRFSRTPKVVALVVLLGGLAGLVLSLAARLLPAGPSGTPGEAALAVLRTAVLAAAAIALAWVARVPRLAEAGWLVYPVLALGGAKLLVEDLQSGRPATLFASFALYGSALILAPRLVRRKGTAPDV